MRASGARADHNLVRGVESRTCGAWRVARPEVSERPDRTVRVAPSDLADSGRSAFGCLAPESRHERPETGTGWSWPIAAGLLSGSRSVKTDGDFSCCSNASKRSVQDSEAISL